MWVSSKPSSTHSGSGTADASEHHPSDSGARARKRKRTAHPDISLEIRRLEEQRSALCERWQERERKDIDERIAELQRTKQVPAVDSEPPASFSETNDDEEDSEEGPTLVTTMRNGKKISVYLAKSDVCSDCKRQMVMIPGAALLSCKGCGRSKPYLDATSASTAYGEEVEFSNFSYKRSNHFQEWLNSFQAKETTEIPAEVFERVMEDLYRQRISDVNTITTKKVREVLKSLQLRKYYEHVTQITCRLNGKRPPRMTPDQEEQCRLMFMAIQGPFEKNCPPDRKNFLSYSYCLYKFCELAGYDEFLPCFSLLKGRDKLFKQDMIFKRICEDLGWAWMPSI